MPLISMIVPVYKVEPYLCRCVDSVLAQTNPDFELVLVDDGSPDRCGVMCEQYADNDARIHVLHRENGGLSAARNTGIAWALANSDAEWITFLDSDDWIHPRYLEALYDAAAQTGCHAVVGGFRRTKKDGDLPELPVDLEGRVVDTESFYCADKLTATVAWGKLYRKKDFEQIRYPDGKIHEDELTTHKILFLHREIAVVDQPLYQYFQNQQGIMRSGWNPKHMAEIEGMREQLDFFLGNGFPNAACCAAKACINSIYRNLTQAKANPQYAEQAAVLRKQLRDSLRRHRALAGVSIQNEPWLFFEAFPIRTLPHRTLKKLKKKIGSTKK